MKSFIGKVAAITGAGSGIGRALAIQLAQQRCNLALSDIDQAGLDETVRLLDVDGLRVTHQVLDVADRQAVHDWADTVVAAHGSVNLIFNNAGVAMGSTVESNRYEDIEWLMQINFWGVVHGTKAFLPHLKAGGDGHIVNVSSVFGLFSLPAQSAYNASKFAVRGYTESLRQELDMADCGVSATCVHPGGIKTNIAKNARIGSDLSSMGMGGEESIKKMESMFLTSPEQAAAAILKAVARNRRRLTIGSDAKIGDLIVRLLPAAYQRLIPMMNR